MVHLGPVPLRAYALMIILGIVVAVVVTGRRLRARGLDPEIAGEIAFWAVPFGILGARIYHVLSTPDPYFGHDGNLGDVVKIWNGGLGIWGAIAGGALGAWIAARRLGVSLALFADAAAPGIILAQAIGRWGNWFNQELYGRATDLPWAVRIDAAHRIDPTVATYQPTFLYEFLWNLVVAGILLFVDRRHRLGRGRLFALYVALYTFGRLWIEMLRIDTADRILGLRVNIWTSALVCVAAIVAFALTRRPVDLDVSPEEQRELGLVRERGRRGVEPEGVASTDGTAPRPGGESETGGESGRSSGTGLRGESETGSEPGGESGGGGGGGTRVEREAGVGADVGAQTGRVTPGRGESAGHAPVEAPPR